MARDKGIGNGSMSSSILNLGKSRFLLFIDTKGNPLLIFAYDSVSYVVISPKIYTRGIIIYVLVARKYCFYAI